MKIEKLDKNIWVVHGFISDSDLESIVQEIRALDNKAWNENMGLDSNSFWVNRATNFQQFSLAAQSIINDISNKVFECFKNYNQITQIGNVNRTLSDGRSMEYHKDNVEVSDLDNMYGIVIYLNDNYSGGKIHYKDLNIEYKPQEGDMVVHYAGYLHGVTEVTEGERYIFTSFVKGSEATTFLGEKLEL